MSGIFVLEFHSFFLFIVFFLSRRYKTCHFRFYNIAQLCIPLPRSSRLVIRCRNITDSKKNFWILMTVLVGAITFFSFDIKFRIEFFGCSKNYSRESTKRNRIVIVRVLSLLENTAKNFERSMPSGRMLFLEFW